MLVNFSLEDTLDSTDISLTVSGILLHWLVRSMYLPYTYYIIQSILPFLPNFFIYAVWI